MEILRFVGCDSVGDDCVLCVCVEGGQELEMDEDSLRLWLHMAVGRRADGGSIRQNSKFVSLGFNCSIALTLHIDR